MRGIAALGGLLTVVYGIFVGWLVRSNWTDFSALTPNEWGDFLAGCLGPLAIFWLVLGYFQQGRELQHSVNALNLQAEELRRSVEQQQAMVRITEKQLELDIQTHDKDNRLTESRDLPFFQLSKLSKDGVPTLSRYQIEGFKLTNAGAHANSVHLSLSPSSISLTPDRFDGFPSGESQRIDLPVEFGILNTPSLIVESTNLKGRTRRQEFRLGSDGAQMVSCFPDSE